MSLSADDVIQTAGEMVDDHVGLLENFLIREEIFIGTAAHRGSLSVVEQMITGAGARLLHLMGSGAPELVFLQCLGSASIQGEEETLSS